MTATAYTIRRIVNPTDAQIEELTDVLTEAFSADDQLKVGFGDDAPRLQRPLNKAPVVAGSLGGHLYVAESEGKVVGVCIWFEPGREIYDSADQREAALEPLQKLYKPEAARWLGELAPKLKKFRVDAWGETTSKDQWYLQRIGVAPKYQGQGIGSALIREIMGKTDGMKIALTTIMKANAEYYAFLGFKVMGHGSFDAPYGKFEITAMLWGPEGQNGS
ncbi:hypothetical protein HGRIS_000141 [Hohenbuehelia grisea]|uniref:N-acetyltransferase domain-containing protein n=1 Tax=Hohenbuehelia grisea TaxID=104357 RepID=A0ABR3JR84_9AGAR